MDFYECFDLDEGVVVPAAPPYQGGCQGQVSGDIEWAYNSTTVPHARLFWNEAYSDVAFLDVAYGSLDYSFIATAPWCDHINDPDPACQGSTPDSPMGATRAAIVRTDLGRTFKVGFVSETDELRGLQLGLVCFADNGLLPVLPLFNFGLASD